MAAGVQYSMEAKFDKAKRALAKLGIAFSGRKFLTLIGQDTLRWVDKNFKQEGTEKKWKPMSKNTRAARRGGGGGARLLRDSGRLAQSFVSKVNLAATHVDVGSADKKAKWHHKGTRAYVISPKNKKVLKFKVAAGFNFGSGAFKGGFAFAKRINHPGLAARPLLPSDKLGERIGVLAMSRFARNEIRKARLG